MPIDLCRMPALAFSILHVPASVVGGRLPARLGLGCLLITLLWLLVLPDHLQAQERQTIPPARKTYMGRTIALTMGSEGAPWLIRETREAEERPSEVIEQLDLKAGMVVCDMGCGNGFYSLLMAQRIQPAGKVLAVDIQAEMLRLLQLRAADQGIDNIEPILSTVIDPMLPKDSVDLLLMVDVYHEFSYPVQMLAGIRDSLKEDGLVALLEYREEDRTVPIKPLHKMSKRQILKEYQANGFKLVKQYDGLPWQHLMFFARDPDWSPPQFSTRQDQ
ncbi:MAG: class I SAM-dependent methyltransferase [bacterium]|nr:class I SAM-dependent methyltransferase [bacterium]